MNTLTKAMCLTGQGLEEFLKASEQPLTDLKEMIQIRYTCIEAHDIRSEQFGKFPTFYVFGLFYCDNSGNTHMITSIEFKPGCSFDNIKDRVLTKTELFEYCITITATCFNPNILPTEEDHCNICGGKFNISDIGFMDVDREIDQDENGKTYLKINSRTHKQCAIDNLDEKNRELFQSAFELAGFKVNGSVRTTNAYGSDHYRGSWFLVDTDRGVIKVGWRKRVINVDFSHIASDTISDGSDVTAGEGYFHAYDVEQLVKRLTILNNILFLQIDGKDARTIANINKLAIAYA